jgi:hypothetical protein
MRLRRVFRCLIFDERRVHLHDGGGLHLVSRNLVVRFFSVVAFSLHCWVWFGLLSVCTLASP